MAAQDGQAFILVLKDTNCPSTQERRRQAPALLGMNILQQLLPKTDQTSPGLPPFIGAAVRRATMHDRTVVGLARVAGTARVPAHSMASVRISGVRQHNLVAEPCHQPLPAGLILVPTLISGDQSLRYVRVVNLTEEDIVLRGRTPIEALHAVDTVDSEEKVTVQCPHNSCWLVFRPPSRWLTPASMPNSRTSRGRRKRGGGCWTSSRATFMPSLTTI